MKTGIALILGTALIVAGVQLPYVVGIMLSIMWHGPRKQQAVEKDNWLIGVPYEN